MGTYEDTNHTSSTPINGYLCSYLISRQIDEIDLTVQGCFRKLRWLLARRILCKLVERPEVALGRTLAFLRLGLEVDDTVRNKEQEIRNRESVHQEWATGQVATEE